MKRRTTKPKTRPPVDEDAITATIDTDDESFVIDPPGPARLSDEAATERARNYRCLSHGRSRTAVAAYAVSGWTITGMCCDRARDTVRAALNG